MVKMRTWTWPGIIWMLLISCNGDSNHNASTTRDTATSSAPLKSKKNKSIVFFGNSITAGYGLDLREAFPARIQEKLDSINAPYSVVNAGVSGETSAGGNSRIDWILKQPVDIFVLELGGNDGLRGIPIAETKKNLQSIIDKVKRKNSQARIVLAGMQIPPNMGKAYTTAFKTMFPELSKKNNTALIPFILEGVGGVTRLNLEDGIHPTAEGHRILAQNVWKTLQPLL